MILRHATTSPWPQGYSSDAVTAWLPGEVRDVPEAVGQYLLDTFPGVFVEETPAEPAPVAEAPPAKRKR